MRAVTFEIRLEAEHATGERRMNSLDARVIHVHQHALPREIPERRRGEQAVGGNPQARARLIIRRYFQTIDLDALHPRQLRQRHHGIPRRTHHQQHTKRRTLRFNHHDVHRRQRRLDRLPVRRIHEHVQLARDWQGLLLHRQSQEFILQFEIRFPRQHRLRLRKSGQLRRSSS